MAALILRQIERGSVTMVTSDVSEPVTLTTTLLDTSKTILLYTVRSTSGSPVDYHVIGRVSSTTQIIFERSATPGTDVIIEYQVVEFSSGIYVQHMSFSQATATTDTAIATIDTSKTFPIVNLTQTGTTYGANDVLTADITSTTNLRTITGSLTACPVAVQVVQIDDATVQRVAGSYGTGATADVGVSSITEGKTFWFFSLSTGTGFNFTHIPQLAYVNNTTLRFTRSITSSGVSFSYIVFVVSLSSGVSVQNVSTVIASSGNTVSPSIPNSITVANTALINNSMHQTSSYTDGADDDAGGAYISLSGLTTTQFTATRVDSPAVAATTNVQVLSFSKSSPSFILIQEE